MYESENKEIILPHLRSKKLVDEEILLQAPNGEKNHSGIIYKSGIMRDLMKMVNRVAPSQASVLILGESGTGKELIARAIHERSRRWGKPFVVINCGALRESLLESELFGHEKGAFTGAYTRKIGLAEVADGGTLFLDEIGELSVGIQAKLLRFLQEGEIFRVGGKESIQVDIRLISATNRKLDQEVERKGYFREDLFYRINTITLNSPALRHRKEDIPALVDYFLGVNDGSLDSSTQTDEDTLKIMMRYNWPGNVRELKNICERLRILSEGHLVVPGDLPNYIRNLEVDLKTDYYDPTLTIHDMERGHIIRSLAYFEGNKTKAAHALGITVRTLYNKLRQYGKFEECPIHLSK